MARKAIILAAGLGTRLRPLDAATPKPLMPVWGESMLSRVAAMLRGWGVEEIAVNCHHLREKIEEWCARNGCVASSEPEILGTGGALNPLREWLGGEPFYLVNGDIVAEGIDALPEAFSGDFASDEIARCIVCEEGPRTIEVEPYSRFVTCWKSLDAGLPGTYTY
ncbi:MAG: NTP transferase domain-containing protein, partial [Kiritimatiellae bacterium]|nr:NTP transferase domain-containing protein [Kiritimatiellia bacterium]